MAIFSHPSVPLVITSAPEGPLIPEIAAVNSDSVSLLLGDTTVGQAVVAELQGTQTGTLYTIPSGKTFTGFITIIGSAHGSGGITVTDSNSVVQQRWSPTGTLSAVGPKVAQVTIAGGGGGNTLTVAVTGAASLISVSITGYIK
jgi:hypothetical protein